MTAPAVAAEPTRGDLLRAIQGLEEQIARIRDTFRALNAEQARGECDA